MGAEVLCGDALTILRTLPDEDFQLVVCSPPYY
jgi:tRNA1(Val) A37 N6-methylase TrmN6